MTPLATPGLAAILDWLRQAAAGGALSSDSRGVAAGGVFLAFAGETTDGRKYIADAIRHGARAVLYEDGDGFVWDPAWQAEHLGVSGLKQLAGPIAAAWHGQPDAGMFTIAVTGTNGKTSCSQWLGWALSRQGIPAAVVGTLGNTLFRDGAHEGLAATGFTTPDAVMLQDALAGMRAAGARALAIEASSIGLHQGRLNGMHIDLALFTNFTRDHLDYHGDMTAYEAAKTILFDWPGLAHAVINLDDGMGQRLVQRLRDQVPQVAVIGYTIEGREAPGIPVLRASDIRSSQTGTVFQVASDFGSAQVKTRLVGHFNVSNALGVAGALLARGTPWRAVLDLVEALEAVPGRMQQQGGQEAPLVVIDYAHTPDALEKALASLRPVARQRQGRLWCVFGCGGDRDPGKRPQMAAVAASAADHVIVTSDNPRNENAADIIEQISKGFAKEFTIHNAMQSPPQVIEDRAAAILWAIKHAAKNDVVLLAGKGHENYQEIRGKKLPVLDADHAALALAARATMKGGL
jgi:UDP-N-acetylmuramoyl-L-alanyl-D-glutamate--2,6-diaminopimelate ligase